MKINPNFISYCKSHNWLDEAMEDQSVDELNGLLKLLKVPESVTGFYRKEYTTLLGGERRCDLVCTTLDDYLLHIEASYNTPRYEDISRQICYGLEIHMSGWMENPEHPKWENPENYPPVKSIFITAQKTSEKEMYVNLKRRCPKLGSEIYTFKDINHQKYINQIKNKISTGEKINHEEIAFLKFITLTTKKNEIHKTIMEAIKLLKQDKTIDEDIKDKIKLIYIKNCILYIDEKYQDQIFDELKMQLKILNDFEEQVRIKSMKEGRNKIEKILELENIPKETINKIMSKSKKHNINP